MLQKKPRRLFCLDLICVHLRLSAVPMIFYREGTPAMFNRVRTTEPIMVM